MPNWSDDLKDRVWDKGTPIKGKNPEHYRKDSEGNKIYRQSYGKDSPMGWVVDHKKPRARGGSDSIRNLQPLQTQANIRKSDNHQ